MDYNFWNPDTDKLIAANYSIDSLADKAENKQALRQRLLIHESDQANRGLCWSPRRSERGTFSKSCYLLRA